jgi:hypothetical protein
MSTTYTCTCGGHYKLPQAADDAISLVTEDNPVVKITVICPHCKNKGVKGGEHMYDEFIEDEKVEIRNAIMLFGAEFTLKTDKEIIKEITSDGTLIVDNPTFMGIPVIETEQLKHWWAYGNNDVI